MKRLFFVVPLFLFGCVGAGSSVFDMPQPRALPVETVCRENLCEITEAYRVVELSSGEYQDQVTVYQIDCGKKTFKVVDFYDRRFTHRLGLDTRKRLFNNSERLIQPQSGIEAIYLDKCKNKEDLQTK